MHIVNNSTMQNAAIYNSNDMYMQGTCEVVINLPRNAATVGTHKTAGDKVGTTKRMHTITTLKTLGHEYLIRGKFRHTHFYIVPFTGNHVVKNFDIRHGWK